MKPLALAIAALAIGAGAVWLVFMVTAPGQPAVTVTVARLLPMGDGHALVAKIENPGDPDILVSVTIDGAPAVLVGAVGDHLPIPEAATPSLATDGAHAMVTGLDPAAEGLLVPVTLTFAAGGAVTTRARVERGGSDHVARHPVPPGQPAPALRIAVTPDGTGHLVTLDVDNFRFAPEAVDGPHRPGAGHAHLYLDGLKLTRVYGDTVRIGALPPGRYEVRVTLNTNDHQTYLVDGADVTAAADLVAQ